jgi:uncharacterized RDD family membrane protein YckC
MDESDSRFSDNRSLRFAPLYKRAAAYALDVLFLLPYLGVLAILGAVFPSFRNAFIEPTHGESLQFLVLTFPVACWFAIWETLPGAATPGKMLLGLCVSFNRPSRSSAAAALRNALKLVPWEINHAAIWHVRFEGGAIDATATVLISATWALFFIYLIGPLFSRERWTLYDWLAGTRVVQRQGLKQTVRA